MDLEVIFHKSGVMQIIQILLIISGVRPQPVCEAKPHPSYVVRDDDELWDR